MNKCYRCKKLDLSNRYWFDKLNKVFCCGDCVWQTWKFDR